MDSEDTVTTSVEDRLRALEDERRAERRKASEKQFGVGVNRPGGRYLNDGAPPQFPPADSFAGQVLEAQRRKGLEQQAAWEAKLEDEARAAAEAERAERVRLEEAAPRIAELLAEMVDLDEQRRPLLEQLEPIDSKAAACRSEIRQLAGTSERDATRKYTPEEIEQLGGQGKARGDADGFGYPVADAEDFANAALALTRVPDRDVMDWLVARARDVGWLTKQRRR